MANTAKRDLEEFENAPIVRAQDPRVPAAVDSIRITREEFYASTDPEDVAVLVFWRFEEQQGHQPSARSVHAQMVEEGMHGDDGQPLRLETIQTAVDRLAAKGLISSIGDAL